MNRLAPADRAAFSKYIASRTFVAGGVGKPLTNAKGEDPATVREAIQLVRDRDERWKRADAYQLEGNKAEAVLEVRMEALRGPMEASRFAPGPTDAYNAVVAELNALRKANSEREQAIFEGR